MIRYLEITPPADMQVRGAKIVRPEVSEGDTVAVGDTLFTVEINQTEHPVPSTKAGTVTELIAEVGERIHASSSLLLLETVVEEETNVATTETPDRSKSSTHTPANIVTAEAKDTMNQLTTPIAVPDIGGGSAKVVELLIEVGQTIEVDSPIVTLESDKASMEVPSSHAGVVSNILVKLEQEVSEGDILIEISNVGAESPTAQPATETVESPEEIADEAPEFAAAATDAEEATSSIGQSALVDVNVPDIGEGSAKVIEVMVKVGDSIDVDDPLITLESDKASMEVPSSHKGIVEEIIVALDTELQEGDAIVRLRTQNTESSNAVSAPAEPATSTTSDPAAREAQPSEGAQPSKTAQPATPVAPAPVSASTNVSVAKSGKPAHASPSIRRFARELGADVSAIEGTGRKGRITQDDVKRYVKAQLTAPKPHAPTAETQGAGIPKIKNPDFSKFGEIEVQPLSRIKRLTAQNLHKAWLNVPHVTHHDEANIEDLENFRQQTNAEFKRRNTPIKLSPLAFVVKAVVNAVKTYPQFNSSLSEDGESLIVKKYVHIGIAVDTPDGLVVPVIRNADTKSVAEIATEMGELAAKARDKKLTMADMSGAGFSISSLGGIGGTGFTPIVNAPEVAILGVSRTKIQPFYNGESFVPAPYLPLSLSYDHRVIDGAEAARFTRHIADVLEDVRRLTI